MSEKIGFFRQIWEDLSVPKSRDPAMRSRWELLFNYPGVWALVWYRLAHRIHRVGLRLLARYIAGFAEALTGIDINPAATIGRRFFIDHGLGVVIGETCEVGDDVTIYQQVTLGGVELTPKKRHPTLEDGVIVGTGAKILGDITIGKNAKIGANSVVVKDVPPDSTAVGIPARIVGTPASGTKFDHNSLPDIQKEMFFYMIKRIKLLEENLTSCKPDIGEKESELEKLFEQLIQSMEK